MEVDQCMLSRPVSEGTEKETFLPDDVSELFKTMISIHAQVHKIAEKRRFNPKPYNGEEPPNEYYPSLPLRSLRPKRV